jgi:hypothetical protein
VVIAWGSVGCPVGMVGRSPNPGTGVGPPDCEAAERAQKGGGAREFGPATTPGSACGPFVDGVQPDHPSGVTPSSARVNCLLPVVQCCVNSIPSSRPSGRAGSRVRPCSGRRQYPPAVGDPGADPPFYAARNVRLRPATAPSVQATILPASTTLRIGGQVEPTRNAGQLSNGRQRACRESTLASDARSGTLGAQRHKERQR